MLCFLFFYFKNFLECVNCFFDFPDEIHPQQKLNLNAADDVDLVQELLTRQIQERKMNTSMVVRTITVSVYQSTFVRHRDRRPRVLHSLMRLNSSCLHKKSEVRISQQKPVFVMLITTQHHLCSSIEISLMTFLWLHCVTSMYGH